MLGFYYTIRIACNKGSSMLVIGLAGGIGTGKSEISRILKELGAAVLDGDTYGHQVYLPNTEGLREIVATFGEDVLLPSGEVDRRALGGKVFGNPEAMAKLNAIAWPRIRQMIEGGIEEQKRDGTEVVDVLLCAARVRRSDLPGHDDLPRPRLGCTPSHRRKLREKVAVSE